MAGKLMKNVVIFMLTLGMMASLCAGSAAQFPDLDEGYSWALEAVGILSEVGVIRGYEDGTFRPGVSVSNADCVLLVLRSLGYDLVSESGPYYSAAWDYAQGNGVFDGLGELDPVAPMSRADIVTVLYRVLRDSGHDLFEPDYDAVCGMYTDAGSVPNYARSAFAAFTNVGIIQGAGMQLTPYGEVTRAQVAVILWRMMNYVGILLN